jgi:hypothetical protein
MPDRMGLDPPSADRFYAAVGRIVIRWGRFENQFDWALRIIVQLPESAPIRPEGKAPIPANFTKKTDLWIKAFKFMPSLNPIRIPALEVVTDARLAFEKRSALVHGHFGPFIRADPPTLEGHTVRHKGDRTLLTKYTIELPGLVDLLAMVGGLTIRMTPILMHLVDLERRASER